jgi:16S rRNA (uracil1498-N3)-methyltransferase
MRINRFFCPELTASSLGSHFALPETVHRHAIQVLRMKPGHQFRLFNGEGIECEAVLVDVQKRSSMVELGEVITVNNESPISVTLLQGVSKGERMDYALQKAVELGVTRVIPVVTERCNVQLSNGRGDKRHQHWQGVMISACEQSGRHLVPVLEEVTEFKEVLQELDVPCRLVLDPMATTGFTAIQQQDNVALLIGPEGGLSDDEIKLAQQAGFQPVRFGPRVLRTETASAAALAIIQALWGDLG